MKSVFIGKQDFELTAHFMQMNSLFTLCGFVFVYSVHERA